MLDPLSRAVFHSLAGSQVLKRMASRYGMRNSSSFARRFIAMRKGYDADPAAFRMYVEIGEEHFEQVRSYVDLADHYLGVIIGEAMGEGFFAGLGVDETISLVNQMVAPYCSIPTMIMLMERLSEEKLARIIDAVFDGLSAQDRGAKGLTGLRAA